MLLNQVSQSALGFSLAGFSLVAPAMANMPLHRAVVQTVVNQVEAVETTGHTQALRPQDTLGPGQTLVTHGLSQAEIQFNDGSLIRLGEQAQLTFYDDTRTLTLAQGTGLLFSYPDQGAIVVETPNAWTWLDSNAAVVRYVPARNLTLIMALANSANGPVTFMVKATEEQGFLPAGHMVLISDAGLQVIEFDLVEFYRTSRLALGLTLEPSADTESEASPIARLRPQLLDAIVRQQPFADITPILDPAFIGSPEDEDTLRLNPNNGWDLSNPTQQPTMPPPGVVAPLPEPEVPTPEVPTPETPTPEVPTPEVPTPAPTAPPIAEPGTAPNAPPAANPTAPPTNGPTDPDANLTPPAP